MDYPFMKTWWPAFLVAVLTLIAVALGLAGRKKRPVDREDPLDQAIEKAMESITDAKLEAAVRKAQSAAIHDAVLEDLDVANTIDDPFVRHAQKLELLEKARRMP